MRMTRTTHLVLAAATLGTLCVVQASIAQSSAPPVSPEVRRVLDEAPRNLARAGDATIRDYASRLAEAADNTRARGEGGYTFGWVMAAQNFRRVDDRGLTERYLTRITTDGESAEARARAWGQLLQWFCTDQQRVVRGGEAIGYLQQIDVAGGGWVDDRDRLLIVAVVAEAHSTLGDHASALALREAARVRYPVPTERARRGLARLDRGDAIDLVRLGRAGDAQAAFDRAFQSDPALIEDAMAPVMAASFCQRLHPSRRSDPGYLTALEREWNRDGMRRHPLSIVLAGQSVLLMAGAERRENVAQLCEQVVAAIPQWRAAWGADARRKEAEAETVGEEFGNLIQYAKRHGLVDHQAALEAAWQSLRPS